MAVQKFLELKISDLRLDLENPRYPERQTEREALRELISAQGSKLVALAEDIAEFGMSPVDRIMVIEHPETDGYVSLEGNRRTAALKVLNTPNLLDDLDVPESIKKKLKAAAIKFDPSSIEPISAVEMPDRESARRWIELRHTGQNDGRGTVEWDGIQTGRFRGNKEILLIDLAKSKFGLSDSDIGGKFPASTLARLIDNPEVREFMGLTMVGGELHITRPINELKKPLLKVIRDLATKSIKVDDVKNAEKQKEYIKGFSESDKPSGKKLKQTRSVAAEIDKASNSKSIKKPKSPLKRTTIVPKGTLIQVEGDKSEQIYYELRRLNVDQMPLAGAVLLRLFVELSVGHFLKTKGQGIYLRDQDGNLVKDNAGNPKAMKINQRIQKACDLAKSLYTEEHSSISTARKFLTNKDGITSIQALHEYTHSAYAIPAESDLKTLWSNCEKFFELMWLK